VGKAVVFARGDVTARDTRAWLTPPASPADEVGGIRDVPHPGEQIRAGRPVCTVFATGRDALDCHAALVERAGRVYADLATPSLRVTRRRA
jgi:predicted ATP-grasp superfamily ATP-dependent carboligase